MATPASDGKKKKETGGQKVSLGYAWYALGVLFLINTINYVDRLSISPAMEHIKRDFHVTDMQMGQIYSAFILVYAVLSVPMGFLSDRGKRTRLIAIGIGLWSLATTISGFMRSFASFFTMRALVGSGEGIYAPSGTAIVADYFPKRLRNTAIAIFMSAMILGGAIAYILAGTILKKTERFDMKLLTPVVAQKGEVINGWSFVKAYETKERDAAFEFEKSGNKSSIVLSRIDEKKKYPGKTDFFGISYLGQKAASPDEKALFENIVSRIDKQEDAPFKEVRNGLKHLPPVFYKKLPAEYKDRVSYDKQKKELVFKGIMSAKDKNRLLDISGKEDYQKAIISMHADIENHYNRSDNWRWIFWIVGPPGLLLAFLAFFLKEPIKGGGEDFLTEEESKKLDANNKVDYSILYKTPSVVLMVMGNILVTYCTGGLVAWIFPYVERFKGMKSADAAMTVGPIVVVFSVLGVIFSGILADKLSKKTPRGNTIVLILGIVLGVPFMYLFLAAETTKMMIFAISACMFFLSFLNGPTNALLISLVEPKLRAVLNGFHILLIHLLGDALSPIIIGYYSDQKNLEYALKILPLFLLAGCIGFAFAGIFVPKDLKAVEARMKASAQ